MLERDVGEYRSEIVDGLTGRVLEVGAGNGMNFAHYGEGIEEVVAVEPEPYMRAQAEEAARDAVPAITVVDGSATALPFADGSFDVVVMCMVMCSIDDPGKAMAEASRVLKPGGSLRFFEHVISSKPRKARIQRLLDRSGIWPGMAGGCHCSRDTTAEITGSGFEIDELRGVAIGPAWGHTNPHIVGRAVKG